ncbi:hypothetical protein BRADI_1g69155v3 [Brachypodium distachyon]|uniref:Uncharacterized protein n=1 Tax=Brachypodium distachyon TaxID=15368 RepID=A0A2K2DU48_BRADI|nr:hypothetical protein BRADI_1g69155v3 [Brachypodium distachyon]
MYRCHGAISTRSVPMALAPAVCCPLDALCIGRQKADQGQGIMCRGKTGKK